MILLIWLGALKRIVRAPSEVDRRTSGNVYPIEQHHLPQLETLKEFEPTFRNLAEFLVWKIALKIGKIQIFSVWWHQ